MKVSVLQYEPDYLAVAANLDRVESMLADLESDLLILPELFATGYFFRSTEDLQSVAEPVPDGPTTKRLHDWSRRLGCVIVAGVPELCSGRLFNSAVVVAPDGPIGRYRKLHLYYQEKLHFSPGNSGLPVFDVTDRTGARYRLGVMVCFDWYYPETARSLALAGADVIAHPSNLVRPDCPRAMPIRALENHVFTATANRVGKETTGDETLEFIGQSLICSPDGDVLGRMDRDAIGLATVSIDPLVSRTRTVTPHNDLFADRRTDAYVL